MCTIYVFQMKDQCCAGIKILTKECAKVHCMFHENVQNTEIYIKYTLIINQTLVHT